jgi:predicted phage terminase large subunit-like protein
LEEQKVLQPQKGKQELMINVDADVIFVGGSAGSAKSYSLLLRLARYLNDPNFRAIYFRRTSVQLGGAGGLWSEAKEMYGDFKPRIREQGMQMDFSTGCSAKFMHMEYEKNRIDHQGLQYSAILWDELTHFTELQFTYLLSRLRSQAEGSSFTMASMNPDADSWVLKWVERYLDDEGLFNEDMLGVLSYFVTINGSPVFASTREELIEEYPDQCYVYNQNTKKKILVPPKSFTFIGSTIFDNQILIDSNPNYLAELQALPSVERQRLLYGNWFARPEGSNYFERDWLIRVDKVPLNVSTCRAYDKASQAPSDVNRYPDYTAGSPLMSKCRDGFYYLYWGFEKTFCDEDSDIIGRFRKRPGERDQHILKQAIQDGVDCIVVLPVDPGAAGKVEYQESAKKLIAEGFTVKQDPMPNNKSKVTRFEPFSSACQNGLVRIVEASFPNKATFNAYMNELESFNGERSTSARHDDWADATASGFNYLCKSRVYKTPCIPKIEADTLAAPILSEYKVSTVNDLPKVSEINI